MTHELAGIRWRFRAEPRVPTAVVACGEAAKKLAQKLVAAETGDLAKWKGVATPDTLVVLGETDSLPWVDGVSYLGADMGAPHLLLPTNREPSVPLDLLEQALLRRSPFPPPLAIIPERNLVVSVANARELAWEALNLWFVMRHDLAPYSVNAMEVATQRFSG